MTIQILATFFVALILIKAGSDFFHKKNSGRYLILVSFFWLIVLVVFWRPSLTESLAVFLGVGRGVDAMTYIAIVALFYLVFKLYYKLEKSNRDLTTLVRKIALLEADKNDQQK